jgi:hypothetical protein
MIEIHWILSYLLLGSVVGFMAAHTKNLNQTSVLNSTSV